MRDKLMGTLGVTFANDVADGSRKYKGRENEFKAFAFDARVQYKFNDKLRAKLFLNYSQIMPGDNNATNDISKQFGESVYHYKNYKGETVGNKAEKGFYAVSSIGYTIPDYGTVNLDGGLYCRDLDNNDGFELKGQLDLLFYERGRLLVRWLMVPSHQYRRLWKENQW